VAVALKQRAELLSGDARQHRRVGDLVAVEVQDREHRPVLGWVEELVGVLARREWAGFGLAITDHARDQQLGVVEGRPITVQQAVAELAALMN
jgi:hypothetical protein